MPRPVPPPVRQLIVERHQEGEPLARIAADLGLPFYTVRKLWRRFRDQGEAALAPDYSRCGRAGPHAPPLIYRAALWLRRRHPGWGAGLIRAMLCRQWPDAPVPHARTLERWFRRAFPPPPPTPAPENPRRAGAPHAVWQVDAKERIGLAAGPPASWLSLVDEGTGAVLTTTVFPPGELAAGTGGAGAGGIPGAVRPVGAAPGDPRR